MEGREAGRDGGETGGEEGGIIYPLSGSLRIALAGPLQLVSDRQPGNGIMQEQ